MPSPLSASGSAGLPACFLTVDLEEWSDARLAGAAADTDVAALEPAAERLLAAFEAAGARATFFTLGRVARRYPDLVRRIARRHEIASHGETHTDLRQLDARRFAEEIRVSRGRLEALAGRAVVGYRAPNWSLGAVASWALPILEQEGMRYDSSLLPGGGLLFLPGSPRTPRQPHRLPDSSLWEFPPTVARVAGRSAPVAGGAFLRMRPGPVLLRILSAAAGRGETPHLHLHPWEVVPPPAGTGPSPLRRLMLFAGAGTVAGKLQTILTHYRGTAVEDRWRQIEPAGRSDRSAA